MNTITKTPAARSMARVAAHYASERNVSIEAAVLVCVAAAKNTPAAKLPQFVLDFMAENPAL